MLSYGGWIGSHISFWDARASGLCRKMQDACPVQMVRKERPSSANAPGCERHDLYLPRMHCRDLPGFDHSVAHGLVGCSGCENARGLQYGSPFYP